MSYYRRADGTSPCADREEGHPQVPTSLRAPITVAPRRSSVVFEIGGEPLLSPNATVDPIAVTGPPRPARQDDVHPVIADMSAILAAQRPQRAKYVYDHSHCWFNAHLAKRMCFKAPYESSRNCSDHTCRAQLVDGTRCPNTVYHPRKNPFCSNGYHHETGTFHHVEHAMAARQVYEEVQATVRWLDYLADVQFFAETFPDLAYASSSSSSALSPTSPSICTPRSGGLPPIVEVAGESSTGSTKFLLDYKVPPLPRSRSTSREGLGIDLGGDKMRVSWPSVEWTEPKTRSSQ